MEESCAYGFREFSGINTGTSSEEKPATNQMRVPYNSKSYVDADKGLTRKLTESALNNQISS